VLIPVCAGEDEAERLSLTAVKASDGG
jgi:hypothetical protein